MAQGKWPSLDGVGIGYHPFLHAVLLRHPDRYDFVEVPIDPYLDEAQRALLDPRLARIGAIADAKPCLLRGSGLSLASAVAPDTAAAEAVLATLVGRTDAMLLREELAFRRVDGRDLGLPQPPSLTPSIADLIGTRCESLRSRLPCGLALGLSLDAVVGTQGYVAGAFLERLMAATACDLAVDVGPSSVAVDPDVLCASLRDVSAGRVVQVVLTTTEEAVWPLLDGLLTATGARSVVIRRNRNLFPLDEIMGAVTRAADALARAEGPPSPVRRQGLPAATAAADDRDLAAARDDQIAFANLCLDAEDADPVPDAVAAVRAQTIWRDRVADVHRAAQLARWASRSGSWRI